VGSPWITGNLDVGNRRVGPVKYGSGRSHGIRNGKRASVHSNLWGAWTAIYLTYSRPLAPKSPESCYT
jgi:hypothetical protein